MSNRPPRRKNNQDVTNVPCALFIGAGIFLEPLAGPGDESGFIKKILARQNCKESGFSGSKRRNECPPKPK